MHGILRKVMALTLRRSGFHYICCLYMLTRQCEVVLAAFYQEYVTACAGFSTGT